MASRLSFPEGMDTQQLPKILKAHEAWIDNQLQRVKQSTGLTAPEHIDLNAIDERWQVRYRPGPDSRILLREDSHHALQVEGDAGDVRGIALVLNRWLHLKAKPESTEGMTLQQQNG